jgi:lysozyme
MMTPEMFAKLRRSVVLHEGYRKFAYSDTLDNLTIGIGYNLTDRGVSDDWINTQYTQDVSYFYNKLFTDFRWFEQLDEDRKIVLIDMCFMGYQKFLEFKEMLAAIAEGDFRKAAFEMLNSLWATQVKNRATTLAHAMLTGIYEI